MILPTFGSKLVKSEVPQTLKSLNQGIAVRPPKPSAKRGCVTARAIWM